MERRSGLTFVASLWSTSMTCCYSLSQHSCCCSLDHWSCLSSFCLMGRRVGRPARTSSWHLTHLNLQCYCSLSVVPTLSSTAQTAGCCWRWRGIWSGGCRCEWLPWVALISTMWFHSGWFDLLRKYDCEFGGQSRTQLFERCLLCFVERWRASNWPCTGLQRRILACLYFLCQ